MATGIGEAASIAGIISLAGQTIQATSKLYNFVKRYQTIDSKFEQTENHIKGLRSILQQLERITSNVDAIALIPAVAITVVRARLSDCYNDMKQYSWKVELLELDEAKGVGRVLRKIKLSADNNIFKEIGKMLANHKAQIILCVAMLGV